jgi:serine/threonine protein kinase/Flp pilus assembly protein TadD
VSDSGEELREVPPEVGRRIEAVCRRFEAAWRTGQAPCLEDYLGGWEGSERAALLRELVPLDADYRAARGEAPTPAQYLARFPDLDPSCLALSQSAEADRVLEGSADLDGAGLPESLGDFRMVRELGRGGMGIVYEAIQLSLGRRVALKVLPSGATLDARQRQRFHNEAHAAACLQHAHIVPVYAVGCDRGISFYAMQLIEGLPLTSIIQQQRQQRQGKHQPAQLGSVVVEVSLASTSDGVVSVAEAPCSPDQTTPFRPVATPSPPMAPPSASPIISSTVPCMVREYYRWAAQLGAQAAEALDHAHQMGVVHRDIKPANLLLNSKGQLWITDFGLAMMRYQDSGLTQTGDIVGTLRYMSPEQALAQRAVLDQRTDIYSLGVTLYELLTLQPAFPGSDRHKLLQQVIDKEPPRPRQLRPSIPRDLRRWKLVAATFMLLTLALVLLSISNMVIWKAQQESDEALRKARIHQKEVDALSASLFKERKEAEDKLRRSLAVIDGFLTRAEETGSGKEAGQGQARLDLSEEALQFYSHVLPLEGSSPSLQWEAMWAYIRVGNIHALRNDLARARQAYQSADELAGKLRDTRVGNEDGSPGITLFAGDFANRPGVEKSFRRALAHWRKTSPTDYGTVPDYRRSLYSDLAPEQDYLRSLRSYPMRKDMPTQLVLLEHVYEDFPTPGNRQTLVEAYRDYGTDRVKAGRPQDAVTAFRRALEHDEKGLQDSVLRRRLLLAVAARENEDGSISSEPLSPWQLKIRRKETCQDQACDQCYQCHQDLSSAFYHWGNECLVNDQGIRPGPEVDAYRESARLAQAEGKGHKLPQPRRLAAIHNRIGMALAAQGQLQEAMAEYQQALRLQPDLALAHCCLGLALQQQGHPDEAVAELKRGHQLGSRSPLWVYPSAQWLQQAEWERELGLERKLPKLLTGQWKPSNPTEGIQVALFCQMRKGLTVTATRLYRDAFAAQPDLADHKDPDYRYLAALAALHAGCGHGKDADSLDSKERARLRTQGMQCMGKTNRGYSYRLRLAVAFADAEQGDLADVLAVMKRIDKKVASYTHLREVATMLQSLGEYDRAIAVMKRILAEGPAAQFPAGMDRLARMYWEAGRLDSYDRTMAEYAEYEQARAKQSAPAASINTSDIPDPLPPHFSEEGDLAATYQQGRQRASPFPLNGDILARFQEKMEQAAANRDAPADIRTGKRTLRVMSDLAWWYSQSGQLDRAVSMGQEALDSLKDKLGPGERVGPDVRRAVENLAFIYLNAGQADKAVPLLEQVVAHEKKEKWRNDNITLDRSNLAIAYLLAGQPDKAVPLLEQVLVSRKAMYAWDHRLSRAPLSNLAMAYLLVEQDGENPVDKDLLRQANLSGKSFPLGNEEHDPLSCLLSLAEAYQRSGQVSKAELLCRNALQTYQQVVGNDNPRTALVLSALGSNLLRQHKSGEAEPFLRQSLTIRTKKAPDDWITFHTQSLLGAALLGQKKYVEAESLLLAGYAGMKQRQATIPPLVAFRLAEALQRLVQLYEATGNKQEAARWRRILELEQAARKKVQSAP